MSLHVTHQDGRRGLTRFLSFYLATSILIHFSHSIKPFNVNLAKLFSNVKAGLRAKSKTKPNIEVTMQVCDSQGNVVLDSLSHGETIIFCNNPTMTHMGSLEVAGLDSTYRGLVYYHVAKRLKIQWNETVRVSVNPDTFSGSHLRFTFRHCSRNDIKERSLPFAMAYLRLIDSDGMALRNGTHELCVYKIEKNGREFENAKYLELEEYKEKMFLDNKGQKTLKGQFG